ncbi:hypothetical protein BDR05DRAFT_1002620 [Suillus weaverae]|nr:hypothetical protein BDR05DRAFT_1002620 [Suillus weaverae]
MKTEWDYTPLALFYFSSINDSIRDFIHLSPVDGAFKGFFNFSGRTKVSSSTPCYNR